MNVIDEIEIGQKFGKWEVINKVSNTHILCVCECGTEKEFLVSQITNVRGSRMCLKCSKNNRASNFRQIFDKDFPVLEEKESRRMQEEFLKNKRKEKHESKNQQSA